MEALAYLCLTQDYEESEVRELNLDGLSKVAAGALGAACVAGTVGIADSASAYGYYGGGCHYRPCYSSYYSYNYYPRYHHRPYYNNYYSYYPRYHDYYSYYPSYDYYSYDYHSYYPSYDYYSYYPSSYSYSNCNGYRYQSYFRDWYAIYYPVSPANEAEAEKMTEDIYYAYVTSVQTKLTELGYYTGAVDGDYGEMTANAVAAYQTDMGMVADGIVGPETGKSLGLGWSY